MEISLYDNTGHAVAYIADDNENSIYTWSGHAVAYIEDENIYGWNGNHLGFFVKGVIYDLRGYVVGSICEMCNYAVYAEYAKYAKYAPYAKCAKYAPFARPALSCAGSKEKLIEFLIKGGVGY